jgi:hypothetical protein
MITNVIIWLYNNINVIIWLYNNINVIIWLDDNILLFNWSYDWAGIILDVPSYRMTPLMLSSGWRIKFPLSSGRMITYRTPFHLVLSSGG